MSSSASHSFSKVNEVRLILGDQLNHIAGVGNDPRAGRKFNVAGQAERYDAQGEYIHLWNE